MHHFLKMDSLSRGQLASRLTLNCLDSYVEPQKLKDVYITVMDVINTLFFIADADGHLYRCLTSQHYHNWSRRNCTSVTLMPREHI